MSLLAASNIFDIEVRRRIIIHSNIENLVVYAGILS